MWRLSIILIIGLVGCGSNSEVSRELGARCDSVDECDERCLSPVDYPGGFCTTACEGDDDCPNGASCADVEGGVCLFACETGADCEFLGDGWSCETEDARLGDEEVLVCLG
jgi:hypothetical protein